MTETSDPADWPVEPDQDTQPAELIADDDGTVPEFVNDGDSDDLGEDDPEEG